MGSPPHQIADFAGRAALVIVFGVLATAKVITIIASLQKPELDLLEIATHSANLAFLLLVACMAIIRLKPQGTSQGLEARFSALAGSSLPLLLLALPVETGPLVRVIGLSMVAVGWVLSVYVLLWLGRSFSVMAQARRLVTTGPYRIVRHPLYLAEEVAVLGVAVLYLSPVSLVITVVHWLFQLRRMVNEETLLRENFPEYSGYSERTPKVIPRLFSKSNPHAA